MKREQAGEGIRHFWTRYQLELEKALNSSKSEKPKEGPGRYRMGPKLIPYLNSWYRSKLLNRFQGGLQSKVWYRNYIEGGPSLVPDPWPSQATSASSEREYEARRNDFASQPQSDSPS
jgi:hypothetical protein